MWRSAVTLVSQVAALLAAEDLYSAAREKMVREQVERGGVRDPGVLRAMRATPRHLFVPNHLREHAYEDRPLAIGYGATISQPYIVGRMTELLQTRNNARVLEIGTGSGYQAAVLSQIVRQVFSIEIVPQLARSAKELLSAAGYRNVEVRVGNGFEGWPDAAPFDRILLTAAPLEVPPALLDQLKPGGTLVAPVESGSTQRLVVIQKKMNGTLQRSEHDWVRFVPMRQSAAERR